MNLASEHIVIDPEIMSGKPCLKGTRVPIAMILSDLIAYEMVFEVANDLSLNYDDLVAALKEIAAKYN